MKLICYIPNKATNDATSYFVSLIRESFKDHGIESIVVNHKRFNLENNDLVFTIRVRDYIAVYLKYRNSKHIFWSQGIGPEEYMMINQYSFKSRLIYQFYNLMEHRTLLSSNYIIMVSIAMKKHYENKHRFKINNSCIIPCYNKALKKEYFDATLKRPDSYVFAGSLYTWQCFEETAQLYKKIESRNSNANLTILTKDIKKAEDLLKQIGVINFDVYYVELPQVDQELSKFKYGFLLRKDHIVNRVATPTKMNTYLSVGLIPIHTAVIDSFEKHLDLAHFQVKISRNDTSEQMVRKVLNHNLQKINYDAFYEICKENFTGYYDDEFNKNNLTQQVISNLKV